MWIKKYKWILIIAVVAAAAIFFFVKGKPGANNGVTVRTVQVTYGSIQKFITATATVQPQNRLEMKPPIGGRIDKILVEEGQSVKIGDVLALMSSTERAALLDAARSQGPESVSEWEEVYKATPVIAPIDGEVIVKSVQPGQTVTPTDPVVVLSDRLIVAAQVDETDIGRVKEGQKAVVTLDAYPQIEVNAVIGHIYYESKTVNNVTIYQVDILPESVPGVFRSGMSANARIIEESKDHILLAPIEAVNRGKKENTVLILPGKNRKAVKTPVELGISDENNVEIISGVSENDVLQIESPKSAATKGSKGGSNPFMPSGPRRQK